MAADLVAFLNARLDDDERAAVQWHNPHACHGADTYDIPCDCGVPARVLADVQAKRALIADLTKEQHDDTPDHYGIERCDLAGSYVIADDTCTCGLEQRRARPLRLLASVYADHADYRPEWRVDVSADAVGEHHD